MTETLEMQAQLQERWLIFWFASGLSLLAVWVAWRNGLFKPFKSSFLPSIRGSDVLKGFVYFIVMGALLIPFLVGLVFALVTGELILSASVKSILHFLMILGGFAGAALAYYQLPSLQRAQLWKQTPSSAMHNLLTGIAVWFICFPIVLAFNQILSILVWHIFHHPFVEQSVVISLRDALDHPLIFGATALGIITLVPMTEEFLFRGLLQNWLKQKFHSAWPAITLSSFIFAVFHYTSSQGITNIELLSSLFLLSCVLGFIYERQRSLWASIGLHGFFNFMSLLMIFKDPTS